jgi:hypothetical protein
VVLAATLLSAWLVVLPGVAFEFYKRVRPGCKPSRDDKESVRRLMTDRLVFWGGAGCLLVLAGLVDRAAWLLAFEYRDLVSVGLWLAVVAAVLRVLAPMAGSSTRPPWAPGVCWRWGRSVVICWCSCCVRGGCPSCSGRRWG